MSRILKRHDTADPITGTAFYNGGTVDLTVYTTVKFQGKSSDGLLIIGGTVTQANADGTWTYEQADIDVSEVDIYSCELECTLSNGKKVHFPNELATNPTLTVDEDVDDT